MLCTILASVQNAATLHLHSPGRHVVLSFKRIKGKRTLLPQNVSCEPQLLMRRTNSFPPRAAHTGPLRTWHIGAGARVWAGLAGHGARAQPAASARVLDGAGVFVCLFLCTSSRLFLLSIKWGVYLLMISQLATMHFWYSLSV